jgi:hypothetical protein
MLNSVLFEVNVIFIKAVTLDLPSLSILVSSNSIYFYTRRTTDERGLGPYTLYN